MKRRLALISVSEKEGIEKFAQELTKLGFDIISSGGTAKYLLERGVDVTDIQDITGYSPVLGHRVVTLAPEIHGGLLANSQMHDELDGLGWKKIDLLFVDFYPLEKEIQRHGSTFESCIEKTDIGGPAMIRSANKGGEVIVMVEHSQAPEVLDWIEQGEPGRKKFLFGLRKYAEQTVSEYCLASARVYSKFKGAPLTGVEKESPSLRSTSHDGEYAGCEGRNEPPGC